MTSLERTAYPRFSRAPSLKELRELYTPTPHDIAFVTTRARGDSPQFALMILLKAFQRLGYFPNPQEIPGAVISHIRAVMRFPDDLVPDIVSRTLYRYHAAIRAYLEIKSEGKYVRHVAAKAIYEAVQVMDTPADLINVAIETLVKEHCELPAFRTLDLLATRVRKLVNGRIFRTILDRLDSTEERLLTQLIDKDAPGHFTDFNRIKEAPKSASLTHLDEWLDNGLSGQYATGSGRHSLRQDQASCGGGPCVTRNQPLGFHPAKAFYPPRLPDSSDDCFNQR